MQAGFPSLGEMPMLLPQPRHQRLRRAAVPETARPRFDSGRASPANLAPHGEIARLCTLGRRRSPSRTVESDRWSSAGCPAVLQALAGAGALACIGHGLAQPNVVGRDFDALIGPDELEGLL